MKNLPCPLFLPRIKREKTGFTAKDVQRRFLLVFALLVPPVVLAWRSSSSTASSWCACRRCSPSSEKPVHFYPRLWRQCSSQDALSTRASVSLMLAQVHSRPQDPTGNPRMDSSGGSYVEGNEYESTSAEIEAMGGDPFFLDDFSADQGQSGSGGVEEQREDWDGIVDDEAHFDFE